MNYNDLCIACKNGQLELVKSVTKINDFDAYNLTRAYWHTQSNKLELAHYLFRDKPGEKADLKSTRIGSLESAFIHEAFLDVADFLIQHFEIKDLSESYQSALDYGVMASVYHIDNHYRDKVLKPIEMVRIMNNQETNSILYLLEHGRTTVADVEGFKGMDKSFDAYIDNLLTPFKELQQLEKDVVAGSHKKVQKI